MQRDPSVVSTSISGRFCFAGRRRGCRCQLCQPEVKGYGRLLTVWSNGRFEAAIVLAAPDGRRHRTLGRNCDRRSGAGRAEIVLSDR